MIHTQVDNAAAQFDFLNYLKQHHPYVSLLRPAVKKDGIRKFGKFQRTRFFKEFTKGAASLKVGQFLIPSLDQVALFKNLEVFVKEFQPTAESFSHYVNTSNAFDLQLLFTHLKKFAFYKVYAKEIREILSSAQTLDEKRYEIGRIFINDLKLHKVPLELLPLTNTGAEYSTMLSEQIRLLSLWQPYVQDSDISLFSNKINRKDVRACGIDRTTSVALDELKIISSSDTTLAFDQYHQVALNDAGETLEVTRNAARIIEQLQSTDSDIAYIQTMDNLPGAGMQKKLFRHRAITAGYLLYVQKKIFNYLELLETGKLKGKKLERLKKFMLKYFHKDYDALMENTKEGFNSTLFHYLNRPIRVCNMIPSDKNTGSRPFWVSLANGKERLEIIDAHQIDPTDDLQQHINNAATHTNPVELCCALRNYKNEPFMLENFANQNTKVVREKIADGQRVSYLDDPAFWNAGMENWLSIFIEMPKELYHPVNSFDHLLEHAKGSKIRQKLRKRSA